MASLSESSVATSVKMLLIGDSGSGKSGALASLARAGYKLRILDFDRGTEILFNLLKPGGEMADPGALSRIDVEICTDSRAKLGTQVYMDGTGFAKSMRLLDKWSGELGSPSSWGPDTVLVLDSLSFLGESIMRYVLKLNARPMGPPQLQDWGQAMGLQEDVLAMLYSDDIKCNVIVTSHVKFVNQEGDPMSYGYPNALGRKLPPVIGRYFNSTLISDVKREQGKAKHVIRTESSSLTKAKTSNPGRVLPEYPVQTGLAQYFEALRGKL